MGKRWRKQKPSRRRDNVDLSRRSRKKVLDQPMIPTSSCSSNNLADDPEAKSKSSEDSHAQSRNIQDVREISRPSGQYFVIEFQNKEETFYNLWANRVFPLQSPAFFAAERRKTASLRDGLHTFLEEGSRLPYCLACECPVKDCIVIHASRPEVVVTYVSLSDTFELRVPINECPR